MRLHGLLVRKCTSTNTSVLVGRRLTTRMARAWTIGARIFVKLEEPTEPGESWLRFRASGGIHHGAHRKALAERMISARRGCFPGLPWTWRT